jgi:endonuclease/exonuclease/phosphatase family metal-dependent hydrolase
VHSPSRAGADIAKAAAATLAWSAGAPAVLGGDFNVRAPAAAGFAPLGGKGVDHVLGHAVAADGRARVLDRGALSDHAPVVVGVVPPPRSPAG